MSEDPQSTYAPRLAREAVLLEIDAKLALEGNDNELLFQRACLLAELGRMQESRDQYIDLLRRAPSHRGALNNLGTLLHDTGYRSAARTAYSQAVSRHPEDPMSLVNLANVLREDGELDTARVHYQRALHADPAHAEAHQGLSYILMELGDEAGAVFHRRAGFQAQPIVTLPYRGSGRPVPLLQLASTTGGNIAASRFLDDHVFQTHVVFPEFVDRPASLPSHQIIFNAIGDADLSPEALTAAQSLLSASHAPVINSPHAVLFSGRENNSHRLARISNIVMPQIASFPRAILADGSAPAILADRGLRFPFLLRTPGFHTGRHFLMVGSVDELAPAVARLPGKDLMVIQYLDARAADGKARKYRVMMIDGELYPLHLAISDSWKVHYFTSGMADNIAYRKEEARFLHDMVGVLGSDAISALKQIQTVLNLDYAGIDFGRDSNGDLLFFEANAAMVVNPPEPDERWAYRRAAVERIYSAVRSMLLTRSHQ